MDGGAGRRVERRESLLGNNGTDGCHFCDYAPTLLPSFRRLCFLVTGT